MHIDLSGGDMSFVMICRQGRRVGNGDLEQKHCKTKSLQASHVWLFTILSA